MVRQRLAAYVDRMGRSLARDPEGGWLGGPTCRPDVFATLFRHLLALYASPAPAPPTPAMPDLLPAFLLTVGGPARVHLLHPILAAAIAALDSPAPPPVQPPASGLGSAEGPAGGGGAGGLLFLLSSAA